MRMRLSRWLAVAGLFIFLLPGWLARAGNPASAREFTEGDYVLTSCVSVAAYAGDRLWDSAGITPAAATRQLFIELANNLSTQRIDSVDELKSMLTSGQYFPQPCWAGGVKGAPAPQHIPYFTLPASLPHEVHFGLGKEAVHLQGNGYVQLIPRSLGFLWPGDSNIVASERLTQACDTHAKDPTGGDRHRRELADPVATALAVGGWPSLDSYLAQRGTFQSYRQLVAKYRWSPSNGFVKNVATYFKQNDIRNPSDFVKNGQRTQKVASDLIFHAATVHPELAQGTWLQSLLQLVEAGPGEPAFASLQDAQSKISGFAGFAAPEEQQTMEREWISEHSAAPGVYAIDQRNRFQCLGRYPALWQAVYQGLLDQAKPPQEPAP